MRYGESFSPRKSNWALHDMKTAKLEKALEQIDAGRGDLTSKEAKELFNEWQAAGADLYKTETQLHKAEDKLRELGWHRCTVLECNCGGYHRGEPVPVVSELQEKNRALEAQVRELADICMEYRRIASGEADAADLICDPAALRELRSALNKK